MIRNQNNLLPISFILLGLWMFIPMTSSGVINKQSLSQQPSEQLQAKLLSQSENRARCGKDSLCRIYGEESELNQENSLKFIAFVNTLSGKR